MKKSLSLALLVCSFVSLQGMRDVEWSSDGQDLVIVGPDKKEEFSFDSTAETLVKKSLEWEHGAEYKSLSWDESGKYIACRRKDDGIDLLSLEGKVVDQGKVTFSEDIQGEIQCSLEDSGNYYTLRFDDLKRDGVSFSSNREYVVLKGGDVELKLFSVEGGEEVAVLEHDERVLDVSWSPIESMVAILGSTRIKMQKIRGVFLEK